MNMHPMWEQYPDIKRDLIDVLTVIDKNITIKDKQARKTVIDLLHAGGKLLRPAFFILMAQTGKTYDREQIIHVAASVEVLHMASLIHDDIIDEADTRRGMPTVASQFGSKYALYTGDYLFCVCFKILAKFADALATIEFNTNTVEKILMGELNQMQSRYNMNMTVKSYLSQISKKTAALFALSCQMGAQLGGHEPMEKMMAKKIGHEVGMAFQILDDILDYTESADLIGKPVLEDMKQGVYSLPLIYAMKQNPAAFEELLMKKDELTDSDAKEIVRLIHASGGIDYAQKIAMKYTDKATGRIKRLPESEAKRILLALTEQLLLRKM